jgi:predicted O-methyltransferase YrrM
LLEWNTDTDLVVAGTRFALAPTEMPNREALQASGALLLRKSRWMVERYEALRSQVSAERVFELGIYEGGSTALLALLLQPRQLVAIDLQPRRTAELDAFITRSGLTESVHPYHGVDQADRARLIEILDAEFGSEPLDLVIDDASHLLAETTASFNLLFPRLRPGGLFVLEDWSCQLERERALADVLSTDEGAREQLRRRLESGEIEPPDQAPLSRLVLELVLTAAYDDGIVAEMTSLRRGWVVVRRGDAPLDRDDFDIGRGYGALGRTLLP